MYGAVGGGVGGAVAPAAAGVPAGFSAGGVSATGAVVGGASGGVASGAVSKRISPISPLTPTVEKARLGPAPSTVMAAERVEASRVIKKRKRASVMGGDYGDLNVQTSKLGT